MTIQGTRRRISWPELPVGVAAAIRRLLRGEVVAAASQPGGFSEGLAARVQLAGGRRAFVKAVSVLADPAAAAFHRREIAVTRVLAGTGATPELIGVYDDGTWVALVFEEIPGHVPDQPWDRGEPDRVLDMLTVLGDTLTPAPVDDAMLAPPRLGGWRALAGGGAPDRLRRISPWAARHLDDLAALEDHATAATAGSTPTMPGDPEVAGTADPGSRLTIR